MLSRLRAPMDEPKLFSDGFATTKLTACSLAIQHAIDELRDYLGIPIQTLYECADYVVIRISAAVNLPSRGTVNGIDIREKEPLLIFFHKANFPGRAPQIRVDRRDFPTKQLPHLNPVFPGEPYCLCLHRGSIDDWYAEHSLADLIERAQRWLEDAAMGHLIKEHDCFEATRIDGGSWIGGVSVFSVKLVREFIEDAWEKRPKGGMAYVASYGTLTSNELEKIRFYSNFISLSLDEVRTSYDAQKNKSDALLNGFPCPGLILWPDNEAVCSEYFGNLPRTINDLYEFGTRIGVNLKDALSPLLDDGEKAGRNIFPVFLCIKRPLKLIHSDSNLEILTFVYFRNESESVIVLPPREPLTTSLAQKLSNMEIGKPPKLLLMGCGALGSKIGIHLARAGLNDITLVDHDWLSPHNLTRHALYADSVGKNKATELEKVIRGIYLDGGEHINAVAISDNVFSILNSDTAGIKGTNLIVDATASVSVLDRLISFNEKTNTPVVRCEIAHQGKLGLMLVEGLGRSPNIGELRASLYDLALDDVRIEGWLTSFKSDENDELGAGLEDITIGLGCSSPTMKIADDTISFHASTQAMTIRNLFTNQSHYPSGIHISYVDNGNLPQFSSTFISVEKYRSPVSSHTSNWTVRIKRSLCDMLVQKTKDATPNETGGLLIGYIDMKRRIIYVTRQIEPPPDSVGWPYAFKMGVNEIPEKIGIFLQKSGGLIGYVGEWHSHPSGSNRLSSTDRAAIQQISSALDKINRPTFTMIVTPNGCYPYVFPSKTNKYSPVRKINL